MKRFISTFTSMVMVLLAAACTDLSGVNARLDDHDKRLKALEGLVVNANTNIQTLQKLLDAEAGKITITNWNETPEGYVLTMSDGSKITLTHGKDGSSPAVGVKDFNGVLYWTLNGEFLLDADGNKIKAEGQDGTSGITPKIRVDAEGYWEVSLDGGKTWQAVTDTNGQKVKAVGSDASIDLVITEDENGIKIVYDGQEFIIPKTGGTTPNPTDRPKLPLEFVAEYNIGQDKISFATDHSSNSSAYIEWEDAVINYGIDADFKLGGVTYYLPSLTEWAGIIPFYHYGYAICFDKVRNYNDVSEEITYLNETKTYTANYKSTGDGNAYAMRYIDDTNQYRSAWLYQYIDNQTGGKILKVTCRYIGPDSNETIETISSLDFWTKNRESDVERYFPACGWKDATGYLDPDYIGSEGNYWSSTEYNADYAYYMNFSPQYAYSDLYYGKTNARSVRLFIKE